MSSPYKKLRTTNKTWVGYINLNKLEPNKAYRMDGIVATSNAQYGPGQQAHITSSKGDKWRTQLPGKYLASLNSTDIDTFKKDIIAGKNPYLIFREQMQDNSYKIDIVEKTPENDKKFEEDAPFDELDDSVPSEKSDLNESNDKEKDPGTDTNDKGDEDPGNSAQVGTELRSGCAQFSV